MFFYVEALRRKNGTDLFQNQPIEFEIVRLDRFCCPIALTIAVQNRCAVLLSHIFWRLHAITNHNLNVSHSTRFLLFVSNRQVSPKLKKIKNPCAEFLTPTKHRFDVWCLSFWSAFVHVILVKLTCVQTMCAIVQSSKFWPVHLDWLLKMVAVTLPCWKWLNRNPTPSNVSTNMSNR